MDNNILERANVLNSKSQRSKSQKEKGIWKNRQRYCIFSTGHPRLLRTNHDYYNSSLLHPYALISLHFSASLAQYFLRDVVILKHYHYRISTANEIPFFRLSKFCTILLTYSIFQSGRFSYNNFLEE